MLYIAGFLFGLILSIIFTPIAILLSKKFNVYDIPNKRKVHTRPIPRWGGIGIFLSFFSSIGFIYLLFPQFKTLLLYKLEFTSNFIGNLSIKTQLMGIIAGSILIFMLGIIDDIKNVRAITKLLVQIIAAYCVMDFGVRISGIVFPLNSKYYTLSILLSQIITILWILGFVNTINLADGLDGLAAGIVTIASGTFFVVSILQSKIYHNNIFLINQLQTSSILSIILCGVCLGFLFYNFNPAIVFMGDSGALLLGFLLGTISIIGTLKTTAVISLFIPVIIIALPVFDVIFAIFRRIRIGLLPTQPDKKHIHHRLLKWGWSQKEVVLFIYVISLILSIIAITLTVLLCRK